MNDLNLDVRIYNGRCHGNQLSYSKIKTINSINHVKYCQQCFAFDMPSDLWQQEAQLSPSDRAMRLVSSNLANYHATVQKLLIRQVLTKPKV